MLGVSCHCDGLCACSDLQLVEDAGHVVADGLFAESKPFGDLWVRQLFGDQSKDFGFTSR